MSSRKQFMKHGLAAVLGACVLAGCGSASTEAAATITRTVTAQSPTITTSTSSSSSSTVTLAAATSTVTATSAAASTDLQNTRPVTKTSVPAPGLRIVAGGSATCEASSEAVPNAYRCFAGNAVDDPCWADLTQGIPASVVCQEYPWQTTLTRLTLSQGGLSPFLQAAPARNLSFPWGVQLSDGLRCVVAQGAHDSAFGKVIEYTCPGSSTQLLSTMTIAHGLGSFRTVSYHQPSNTFAHGPTETVKTAWYGIGDDGDQLAAERNTCSASALAFVAQENISASARINDGNYLLSYTCADGYALADNAGDGFEGQLIFQATPSSGWKQVAAGSGFYPTGGQSPISDSVLRVLDTQISAAGHVHVDY